MTIPSKITRKEPIKLIALIKVGIARQIRKQAIRTITLNRNFNTLLNLFCLTNVLFEYIVYPSNSVEAVVGWEYSKTVVDE